MMINKKMMLLAPSMILGAVVMAAETPKVFPERSGIGGGAETLENIGRQGLLFRSTKMVEEANKLMLDHKFREAITKYRDVVRVLENSGAGFRYREKMDFCRKRIAECYYNMAEDAMKRADELAGSLDFEDAVKMCEEALEFCPEKAAELKNRIEFYKKRRDAAVQRENLQIDKLDSNYNAQEYEIQLLIEQGIVFMRRAEYMKARRKFEQVLLIDPYNEAAIQNLLGINNKILKAAAGRANATVRHNIGGIEWSGAIPVVADAPVVTGENQLAVPEQKEVDSSEELRNRLKGIIIQNFTIEDNSYTFADVVENLRSQIDEALKEKNGQKEVANAINFVVRDFKYKDPNDAPKLAGFITKEDSVYDILTNLQKRGDLSFKLDDNIVVIAAAGVVLEEMTVEVFPFGASPDENKDTLMDNLKSVGVSFPEGSSLNLVSLRDEVVSRNTPTNQKLIKQWLAKNSDKGTPMVQIMFKFLEVSQNDLDELGFNWQYSRFNSNVNFEAGGNMLLRHYSNKDANDRFAGTAAATGLSGNVDPDATFNLNWQDSKNSLWVGMYALDWADSSDILYSPRVTTLAGTTAVVNMGEKHHYPGDYEDAESDTAENARVYVTQPQAALDDERTLGIRFSIRPSVTGNLIQSKVNFTILQFDSWLIVDSRNPDDPDDDGEFQKKAVITDRTINTDVTLKDGETVLIGSISQDLTTIMNDKIPILGDIPFIGRFFQTKFTVSKKNNLLVFMTCKLVGPDGSAWNKDPETGAPANVGGERGFPVFPRNL